MRLFKKALICVALLAAAAFCGSFLPTEAQAATEGNYTYSVFGGKATIAYVSSSISGDVVIPDTMGGYPVTSIARDAFRHCSGLRSVTIPDSVTSIDDYAFNDCTGLTSVTIGSGVTSIGKYAFCDCIWLTDVYITDISAWWRISFGNEYANPIYYADTLHILDANGVEVTELVLKETVTAIPEDGFKNCENLVSVTIPDSVTSIGDSAFKGCTSLTSITIPDSVTSIGGGAFSGCTSLTSIIIPDGVTSIDGYTFSSCWSLRSITIPDGVTSIAGGAFYSCNRLGTVYYCGTKAQREKIQISKYINTALTNATWVYHNEEHVYDNACDTRCNICGDRRVITHEYSTWWSKDADSHWHACVVCGEKGEVIAHIPGAPATETTPQRCEACSYVIKWPDGFTCISGDVDGDGELSDWDGVMLARYLAGWPVEVVPEALDIDGDGEVTDWDGVLMDRYLAGWDITIG